MHVSELFLPEVREALQSDPAAIRELVEELHPVDAAEIFLGLKEDEQLIFLKALLITEQVEILEELDDDLRADLFEKLAPDMAARLVAEMSADERADLFRELPTPLAAKILAKLSKEDAKDLRSLLAWPEGTAGALMTTDYVELDAEMTVAQAIERIREVAEDVETIYYAYAISPEGSLRGVVSLRSLVLSKPDRSIADLMDTEHLVTVHGSDDQAEVTQVIAKYDLLALPVVDDAGRLLGIITVDDTLDVAEEEATEEVQRLSGMEPLEDSYLKTTFFQMIRSRAGWLILLFVGEMFTGNALRHFEESLQEAITLVFFIPLLISAGGNTGSQSAGLLIRALAIGEVVPKQTWSVLKRELTCGLMLSLILAVIGAVRALLWSGIGWQIALIVALALICIVTMASVVGGLMPILVKRVGMDPAVASAPLVATIVDIVGIVLYFSIAQAVLTRWSVEGG
ncbi:MAG: magnesium transporter [Myxococcales bacterium]|jgi:magnesium transporter|nr:magnesium transporter [Myxococcales bacterium]